jgi:hypothetical protein
MFAVGGFRLRRVCTPGRSPFSPLSRSGFSVPETPGGSTWGSPLRRTVTLTNEFRHAIKNSPTHRLQVPFSGRCCAKNTQLGRTRVTTEARMGFAMGKNPIFKQELTIAADSRRHGRFRFLRNRTWHGRNCSPDELDSRNRPRRQRRAGSLGPRIFAASTSRKSLLHTSRSAAAKAMQRFGQASCDLRGHKTIILAQRKYSRQESSKEN